MRRTKVHWMFLGFNLWHLCNTNRIRKIACSFLFSFLADNLLACALAPFPNFISLFVPHRIRKASSILVTKVEKRQKSLYALFVITSRSLNGVKGDLSRETLIASANPSARSANDLFLEISELHDTSRILITTIHALLLRMHRYATFNASYITCNS